MKIRIIGSGWFGCHLGMHLSERAHQVEIHEVKADLFTGASGNNPARIHIGPHYPRSKLTRAACQEHNKEFLDHYGHLTHVVPINIYAIAQDESLVDFGTYKQVLTGEIEFITIYDPADYGLKNVEGAILVPERHIIIDKARTYFKHRLSHLLHFNTEAGDVDSEDWDITIDCSFCALDNKNIDRYEPCVVGVLKGDTIQAVTIMDGPFSSIYPWQEDKGLLSISSAKFTPLGNCRTWEDAQRVIDNTTQVEAMSLIRERQVDIVKY